MQDHFLVAGLGKTGLSIAHYLKRRGYQFSMFDTRENADLRSFEQDFPLVDVFLGKLPDTFYEKISAVISSPGVSLDHPVMHTIKQKNIPIWGDIEYLAREVTAPIIAITGTNGKSTVTTLVGEMAKAAGLSVAVAGNIGDPVLNLLDDGKHYDLWVLELSSFQLELTESLRPLAATILNITPDHLDRHHTLKAYTQAKQQIYVGATYCFYNRDDQQTYPQCANSPLYSYGLSTPVEGEWGLITQEKATYLAFGEERILSVEDLRIKGEHNWSNALAACALANAAGISRASIIAVLKSFAGLPHRSQWIRKLDNVDWINDSKGTNIGATISAISGIGRTSRGKIVLIAGGQGKGADFNELRAPFEHYVRAVILIGEDAMKMDEALRDTVETMLHAPSLEEAVLTAKLHAKPGDVVLLSPACASLDMFRDFNHRGEQFTTAVCAL
jgi:UDP-N-acetylmuramoylalanine--D-glutamate ligase